MSIERRGEPRLKGSAGNKTRNKYTRDEAHHAAHTLKAEVQAETGRKDLYVQSVVETAQEGLSADILRAFGFKPTITQTFSDNVVPDGTYRKAQSVSLRVVNKKGHIVRDDGALGVQRPSTDFGRKAASSSDWGPELKDVEPLEIDEPDYSAAYSEAAAPANDDSAQHHIVDQQDDVDLDAEIDAEIDTETEINFETNTDLDKETEPMTTSTVYDSAFDIPAAVKTQQEDDFYDQACIAAQPVQPRFAEVAQPPVRTWGEFMGGRGMGLAVGGVGAMQDVMEKRRMLKGFANQEKELAESALGNRSGQRNVNSADSMAEYENSCDLAL